jgi:predicted amidohydrolase YtcJ
VSLVGAAIACEGRPSSGGPADLVFRGGAIYTVDTAQPWVHAVAVRGGRIVYAGDERGLKRWIGDGTRTIDLTGRSLLPGFHDSHVHPVTSGIELGICDISDAGTRQEILAAISRCARQSAGKTWVTGSGWALPPFPHANPNRRTLDSLIPDRPAFFGSADEHSAWVNTRALALAHITRATPDPPHGRIERDPKTGEASGTLRESAVHLVDRMTPPRNAAEYEAGAKQGLAMASRFGITSVQEASADSMVMNAYASLEKRGELNVRVNAALYVDPERGVEQVKDLVTLRNRYTGTLVHARSAKMFADGVVEARTAFLLAPYSDGSGSVGDPNFAPPRFDSLAIALDKAGFQIHVHAIGDGAVHEALDAFEAVRKVNGARDSRHQIAHLELIDSMDVPRFRELGVYADFQPLWAYRDDYIAILTEPALGPERSQRLYPIGDVIRSGATVVAGSDWGVSSMNPLEAIQVAVTRRDPSDTTVGPIWLPEQLANLPQMIAAYTLNGARVDFTEQETGSIQVGKWADLVVLDHDLFNTPPTRVHTVRVLHTYLGGREVYRDSTVTQ